MAERLWRGMYRDGRWARSFDDDAALGDAPFSRAFVAKASAAASLHGGLTLQAAHTAPDGTHKLVFALHGGGGNGAGGGSVETVLIPMTNKDGSQPRYTACVSTQVGCAMNCQVRPRAAASRVCCPPRPAPGMARRTCVPPHMRAAARLCFACCSTVTPAPPPVPSSSHHLSPPRVPLPTCPELTRPAASPLPPRPRSSASRGAWGCWGT